MKIFIICIAEMRNAYKIVVGKPQGKRSLGIRRCRWNGHLAHIVNGEGFKAPRRDDLQWDSEPKLV
jgi:hypothetical protein